MRRCVSVAWRESCTDGLRGQQGTAGQRGPPGEKGERGRRGRRGHPGVRGADGVPGVKSTQSFHCWVLIQTRSAVCVTIVIQQMTSAFSAVMHLIRQFAKIQNNQT